MSLSSALNTALSGLQTTQAGIGVVSSNIANSGTAGYVKRTLNPIETISGGTSTGVRAGAIQRSLDTIIQTQLRQETSGAGYTDVKSSFYGSIDQLYGTPGDASALDGIVNTFSQSLTALQNDPSSYANKQTVLQSAQALTGKLNNLSSSIQTLRQGAEQGIADSVTNVNDLLSQLSQVSASATAAGGFTAPLLDQRDGIIDQISKQLDVRVSTQSDGRVSLFTSSGVQLFDGTTAAKLSFNASSSITAQSTYNTDPTKSGVGTITVTNGAGGATDLVANKSIKSGQIAAYLEQRDDVLPEAQNQLDELAAGLSRAFSDTTVNGTAVASGGANGFAIDLSGLTPNNAISLETTLAPSGTVKRVQVDISGGTASAVSALQAAVGSGYTVSATGSTIQIVDDGAANTTDVKGFNASTTQTSLTSGTSQLPFFTDGAGSPPSIYNGAPGQITGLAGRISLNPGLLSNPDSLVKSSASTASGDATRPTFLANALTGSTRTFAAENGGGLYSGSPSGFASRIIQLQSANATAASNLNQGQQVVLSTIQGKFADTSGVNIDQEMTQLIQLQTAYSANARVISAAKDMMDMLLRI